MSRIIHNRRKYIYFLSLCLCGCNEIVYGNHKWVSGHNTKMHNIGKRFYKGQTAHNIGKTLNEKQYKIYPCRLP